MSSYHVAKLRPMPGTFEAKAIGCGCPSEQPRAFQGLYLMSQCCTVHGQNDPKPLTRAQHRVYLYIHDYIEQHGYAPALTEIAERFDYSTLSTVHEHLSNLAAKHWIVRAYGDARAITCLVDLDADSRPPLPTGGEE